MARWTVLRSWPVRRAISRIESRSTKRILRISAHLSTSSKSFLLASVADRARVRTPPDGAQAIRWGNFRPAEVGDFSAGALTLNAPPAAIEVRFACRGACPTPSRLATAAASVGRAQLGSPVRRSPGAQLRPASSAGEGVAGHLAWAGRGSTAAGVGKTTARNGRFDRGRADELAGHPAPRRGRLGFGAGGDLGRRRWLPRRV